MEQVKDIQTSKALKQLKLYQEVAKKVIENDADLSIEKGSIEQLEAQIKAQASVIHITGYLLALMGEITEQAIAHEH
ncbi:hypothetical protein [uncultured Secundilactobacillus sp.]|uniref:hypothetical protein n=1 Tax=uncultured Secundilactobacillus sp. TaxID=2813935 RepID=UPI002585E21C|nr:hypothetical protein [uncultured Secundilactobacillus sp.]